MKLFWHGHWPTTILFAVVVALGFWVARSSWDGTVLVYVGDARSPAALRQAFDFSHLEGEALREASHRRLISGVRQFSTEKGLGLELGHFVTKGPSGEKEFACHVYNKIELQFVAEGMAVHGKQPQMIVEAACEMAQDINRVRPIWIPMSEIMQMQTGSIERTFYESSPVHLKFHHLSSQWPRLWVLRGVRMYSDHHVGQELSMGHEELRQILSSGLTLEWPPAEK